ncbi:MAG TPA: glycosyl transferase [Xanthobacteraceae bacterium]|jgi:UDP-N-acetylmuramyl pentapeptide phosphotransferase/UDP-N-acetylglucosamine-1-phosphate transferase|nr:glycosyl transferase [Xanthobacteraceae bacterium]
MSVVGMSVVVSAAIVIVAAILCAALIVLMRPLLARYALAIPNARSSHATPTPQGGGAAVVVAAIVVAGSAIGLMSVAGDAASLLLTLLGAVIVIAATGVMADLHRAGVVPRFALQALAVAIAIYALPVEFHVLPFLPVWLERVGLVIGTLWFVNLTNFMDGLDLMTAAEAVPVTIGIAIIGLLGVLPLFAVALSLALCGAMIGFGYFNRPVAKLFLGDIGSLSVGLVLAWLLILLAGSGGHTAAILLPLYYVADATITLLRRLINREPVWQAHRTHFYQRATDGGYTVIEIVARVFAINLALGVLATGTVIVPGRTTDIIALIAGIALVAWLLTAFARGKSTSLARRVS